MSDAVDRRTLLKIVAGSFGAGALYSVLALGKAEAAAAARRTGEAPAPFTFVQMSDTHVGFEGAASPLGAKVFERAVEVVNGLDPRPELVLFTGDLTHDSEKPGESAARMARFREIAARLKVPAVRFVPGEHDAGLDGGALYRSVFGEPHAAFDHRGVHFVGLDNVSRGRPEVGAEQLAWLKKDLARFAPATPLVVYTHRPLFDLKPEWEWYTEDGDEVMKLLAPFENVTVLYGHIHREHAHAEGRSRHFAARSLVFAFPDPETAAEKKPIPFDAAAPFREVGIRRVREGDPRAAPAVEGVELTLREVDGKNAFHRILKGELVA